MPTINPASHDDARVILDLYELRREEKLREAREWYRTSFFPRSFDDLKSIPPTSTENTYFRMVTTYWDMAASFVVYGALHAELFLESGSEMLMVWAKLEPFVSRIREEFPAPRFLINVEKVIEQVPWAGERVKAIRAQIDAASRRQKPGRK